MILHSKLYLKKYLNLKENYNILHINVYIVLIKTKLSYENMLKMQNALTFVKSDGMILGVCYMGVV